MPPLYLAPLYDRDEQGVNLKIQVKVEKWRCIAYGFFWTMVVFAKLMTTLFVDEILKDGADPSVPLEQKGCGPFNRDPSTAMGSKFGLVFGEGFDFETESHLVELFGFGNICTYWDYTPSRELTALYFPFFEYSIAIYLILDWANTKLSYKRGELPTWFYYMSGVFSYLSIFLCICFRMIFVVISYENPKGHTAGFLGLQIALIMVAIQNVNYVIMTGQTYKTRLFGEWSSSRVACLAKTYLILNLCISAVKVWATVYIVKHGVGPDLYKQPTRIPGIVTGRIIDLIWMLFNAIIPFFIAVLRMRNEEPLEIDISIPSPTYVNSAGEIVQPTAETEPLASEAAGKPKYSD